MNPTPNVYNTNNSSNNTKLNNNITVKKLKKMWRHIQKDRQLLIMFIPCLLFYIIFRYGPIYGIIIAFKKYDIYQGFIDSPWVGFKYFQQFFQSKYFFLLFRNTILLGLYHFLWTFPCPIIFAILLNEIRAEKFKKAVQTVSYLPSFLSIVIIASMIIDMLSPTHGIINKVLAALGFEKQYFMIKPKWFRTIYIASDIWVSTGFDSIIYLSALSSLNQNLYEAGKVDGCNRFQSTIHITLPGLLPTIATMFIIRAGNIFRIGYEKVLLLYNPMTYEVADIFSTFVYRKGLLETNYSYATAVGLFESIVALIMLVLANAFSRKLSKTSLW